MIGAGNRRQIFLEYARRYPDRLQLVAAVELNDFAVVRWPTGLDRRRIASRYVNYDDFADVEADMVPVSGRRRMHFIRPSR